MKNNLDQKHNLSGGSVNNKPYQVGEIVYATYGFGIDKFVVKAVNDFGVALMTNELRINILSSESYRTFYRTGVIKKWYEFWK